MYELPSQIFSITICTRDRHPLFENEKWSRRIISSLEADPFDRDIERYAYCLMPDHLHLQIAPREVNIIDSINRWKSYTGHLLRKDGLDGTCWQRGFYDHAFRKEENIRSVAEYIVYNPVRAGLADDWREYPYSWHRWM
jgi:putative transposase